MYLANCVLVRSFIAFLRSKPGLRILEQETNVSHWVSDRKFEDELSRRSSIADKLSKQRSGETIKRNITCGCCGNPCLLM